MVSLFPENRRYWLSSLLAILVMSMAEILNSTILRIIPLHGGDGWAGIIWTVVAAVLVTFPRWPTGSLSRWLGFIAGIVSGCAYFYWNSVLTGSDHPDLNRETWGRLLPFFYGFAFGLPAGTLKGAFVHKLMPSGFVTSTGSQLLPPAPVNVAPGLYVVQDNPNADFNIVFVHGVHGHYEDTWRSSAENSWPHWIASYFANSAVYSIQYSASVVDWTGNTMPLVDRAGNVLDLLSSNKIFSRPTVFIVHSFGGLVLKQICRIAHDRDRQDIIQSIRCIVFLATPHTGSRLGEYVRYLAVRFLARPTVTGEELDFSSAPLRELNQWYRNHPVKHNVIYFETQNTLAAPGIGFRVVDEVSSDIGIPNVYPIAMEADHLSICKPLQLEQQIVRSVNHAIEDVLANEVIGGNTE
jgi:hypothetical protein